MSQRKFTCPVQGCGREAEFKFECEEVPMPPGMQPGDLERKPPLHELGRNFLVECPKHGRKIVQEIGHHITSIPKKPKKKHLRSNQTPEVERQPESKRRAGAKKRRAMRYAARIAALIIATMLAMIFLLDVLVVSWLYLDNAHHFPSFITMWDFLGIGAIGLASILCCVAFWRLGRKRDPASPKT